jgi:hypothetical protein
MRKRRAIGAIVATLLALIAGGIFYLDYNLRKFGECHIVRLTSIPSPDGSKSVITFRKDCGATVPDSTHASIASTGMSFSPERTPPFFSVLGDPDILVAWSGENTVKMSLIPGGGRILKRDLSVENINIEYL